MSTWPLVPGVPAAGHVTAGGWWHPGKAEGCVKCEPPAPRWCQPGGPHNPRGCDCGEGG